MSIIKQMSYEQFKRSIVLLSGEEVAFLTNIGKGHAKNLHAGLTDMEMIGRQYKEKKDFTSSFENMDRLKDCLSVPFSNDNVLSKLYNWLQSDKKDFPSYDKYKNHEINMLFKEPIGYGFKSNGGKPPFEKCTTRAMRLVVERDFEDGSAFGFYLKTAYPIVDKSLIKAQNIIHDTDVKYEYKDLINSIDADKVFTPMERLLFEAKDMGYDAYIQYVDHKQQLKVVSSIDKDSRIIAYYSDDNVNYKLQKDSFSKSISITDMINIADKKARGLIKLSTELKQFRGEEKGDILKKALDINSRDER